MPQSLESNRSYASASADVRRRFSSMSEFERLKFAVDHFKGYIPHNDPRGGTAAHFRPLYTEHTEHSFNTNERLFLVTEALGLMEDTVRNGASVRVHSEDRRILSTAGLVRRQIGNISIHQRFPVNVLVKRALYTSLIATVLNHPHTAPAMDAMLDVAGHPGISAAAREAMSLVRLCNDCLSNSPVGYWSTKFVYDRFSDTFNSSPSYLMERVYRAMQQKGKLPTDFRRVVAAFARMNKRPEAVSMVQHLAEYFGAAGEKGRAILQLSSITDKNELLSTVQSLLKSSSIDEKKLGLQTLKLFLQWQNSYDNRKDIFWGRNDSNRYEVVCLGRNIAQMVQNVNLEIMYDLTEQRVLQNAPNRTAYMSASETIADQVALKLFLGRVSRMSEADLKPVQQLALSRLHFTTLPDDGIVSNAMLNFI